MNVNAQVLKGHWNEIKGKLHQRWGELSEKELDQAEGNATQLVGLIQRKTGETREQVEAYLERLTSGEGGLSDYASQAADTVRGYAGSAAESLNETKQKAVDSMKAGYAQSEAIVRDRPAESLAVCFGAGLIGGIVVGLLLRPR